MEKLPEQLLLLNNKRPKEGIPEYQEGIFLPIFVMVTPIVCDIFHFIVFYFLAFYESVASVQMCTYK